MDDTVTLAGREANTLRFEHTGPITEGILRAAFDTSAARGPIARVLLSDVGIVQFAQLTAPERKFKVNPPPSVREGDLLFAYGADIVPVLPSKHLVPGEFIIELNV